MDGVMTQAGLAARVFHAIAGRLVARASDVAIFTASGYSFEEWMNWEAYAACAVMPGWASHPKPRYGSLGAQDCRDFGDLLVEEADRRVLVEVGLVHDYTGDKWRDKLDWDVQKLARPLSDGVLPLQIIVLVSKEDIGVSQVWQTWLAKVPCWNRATELSVMATLPSGGTILVRGWTGARV